MTSLITCLSTGKGTWTTVAKTIAAHEWDKVFIVTNEFGKDKFQLKANMEFIVIADGPLQPMVEQIRRSLEGKIADLQVAVNLDSGTGKEHMAVISAVLRLGLALRLVTASADGSIVEV